MTSYNVSSSHSIGNNVKVNLLRQILIQKSLNFIVLALQIITGIRLLYSLGQFSFTNAMHTRTHGTLAVMASRYHATRFCYYHAGYHKACASIIYHDAIIMVGSNYCIWATIRWLSQLPTKWYADDIVTEKEAKFQPKCSPSICYNQRFYFLTP